MVLVRQESLTRVGRVTGKEYLSKKGVFLSGEIPGSAIDLIEGAQCKYKQVDLLF